MYDTRHTYASHLIASGAAIDYVAKQLGHRKITTTLTYYAHWFPKGDRRHIEQMERVRTEAKPLPLDKAQDDAGLPLDDEPVNDGSWHQDSTISNDVEMTDAEVREKIGSPGWTRTSDILINSQALYRLSYRGVSVGEPPNDNRF